MYLWKNDRSTGFSSWEPGGSVVPLEAPSSFFFSGATLGKKYDLPPGSRILNPRIRGSRIQNPKSFWYLSPEITLRPNLAILAGALRGHLAELARRLVAVGLASLPCKVARLARLALASLPCKVGAGCRLRWWGDGLTLERDRWKADGKDPWRENFPTFHTVFWWNQLKPIDFCTEINLPLIRLYHWQIVHALHGKYFSIVWRFEVHAHVVEEDIVYTL